MKSKRENIAEYILYLWQLEDYLRAFPAQANANNELFEVYQMMQTEGLLGGGHLQIAQNALAQAIELHEELLQDDATYAATFTQLQPSLTLFKAKTDTPTMPDVQAALTFLYHIMLLKLQKKNISQETMNVQKQITALLKYLSKNFKEQK